MAKSPDFRRLIDAAIEFGTKTAGELAEEVGVSRSTLYLWRSGDRHPTPKHVARLADALERRSGRLTELAKMLKEAARQS